MASGVCWIIRSSKGCSARWTQETNPALSVAGSFIIMSNTTLTVIVLTIIIIIIIIIIVIKIIIIIIIIIIMMIIIAMDSGGDRDRNSRGQRVE